MENRFERKFDQKYLTEKDLKPQKIDTTDFKDFDSVYNWKVFLTEKTESRVKELIMLLDKKHPWLKSDIIIDLAMSKAKNSTLEERIRKLERKLKEKN